MCEASSNVGRLAVCETYLARAAIHRPLSIPPEVALVDPIALSKDRKNAPLSAPS